MKFKQEYLKDEVSIYFKSIDATIEITEANRELLESIKADVFEVENKEEIKEEKKFKKKDDSNN